MTFEYLPGHFVKVKDGDKTIARAHMVTDGTWNSGGANPIVFASEADAVRAIQATFVYSALNALTA